ncbi:MAG: hypothetical protein R2710_29420 [Acidimicrobiales bacterium]
MNFTIDVEIDGPAVVDLVVLDDGDLVDRFARLGAPAVSSSAMSFPLRTLRHVAALSITGTLLPPRDAMSL